MTDLEMRWKMMSGVEKTKNYLVYGSPEIVGTTMVPDQVQKGFIYTDKVFNPSDSSFWTLQTKIKMLSYTSWADIFGMVDASGEQVRSYVTQENEINEFYSYLSNNSSSWNLASNAATLSLPSIGDDVVVQVQFELRLGYNNRYHIRIGYPDLSTWSSWANVSGHPTYGYHIAFGGGWGTGIDAEFDLTETKIWIDNALWWEAIG